MTSASLSSRVGLQVAGAAILLALVLIPLAATTAQAGGVRPQATTSPSATASTSASATAASPSASPSGTSSAATATPSPSATTGSGRTCRTKPQVLSGTVTSADPVVFNQSVYDAGAQIQAEAEGYRSKEKVEAVLEGSGAQPSTVVADTKGKVSASFTVPTSALAGWHTVTFTGWCSQRPAVGQVLVGRLGAGPWPGQALPGWFGWAVAAISAIILGSAGWAGFQWWRSSASRGDS
jgi:hypothetical protein